MNIEHSVTVQSKSSSSRSDADNAVFSRTSLIDHIFPLFDTMSQKTEVGTGFYIIPMAFMAVQTFITSLWLGEGDIWHTADPTKTIMIYIASIFLFKPTDEGKDNDIIRFCVYLGLLVVIIINFLFQSLYFKYKRRIIMEILYPCRWLIEMVPMLLIIPSANFMGELFLKLLRGSDSTTIILFVFMVLVYVGYVTVFFYVFKLLGASPYLASSIFSSLDIGPYISTVIIASIFQFICIIHWYYQDWLLHIILVIHIIICIFYLMAFLGRPFISLYMNVLSGVIVLTMILWDVIRFVNNFQKGISSNTYAIIYLVFILVSIGINALLFYIQQKHLIKKLDVAIDEENEDMQKYELFKSLKLETSEYYASLYLNFTLTTHSPFITDFSLIKYLFETRQSAKILMKCIRIVSFFPGENRLLNKLFNEFIKQRKTSSIVRFMSMQIRRLNIVRQSSSSLLSAEKLKDLMQISKGLEAAVKGFWTKNDYTIGELISLRNNIMLAKSMWDESLIDFPNSTSHSEAYGSFLIECCTDFTSAIYQNHRIAMIEGGHNFCNDYCFKNFVHIFPEYLKLDIIDMKGNIIKQKKHCKNSSSNSSAKNNEIDSFNSSTLGLDAAIVEDIGKKLFNHSRLRIALQNSTFTKKAKNAKIAMYFLFYSVVISFAIILFVFIYHHTYFDQRGSITEKINLFVNVNLNFFKANMALIFFAAVEAGKFDFHDKVVEMRKSDDLYQHFSIIPFTSPMDQNTVDCNLDGRNEYNEFIHEIALMSADGIDLYSLFHYLFNENIEINYCSTGDILNGKLANFKTILVYSLMCQSLTAGTASNTYFTNTNNVFCTLIYNSFRSGDIFYETVEDLETYNTEEYNTFNKDINLMIYIIAPSLFLVTFIPFIIIGISYHNEIILFQNIIMDFSQDIKAAAQNSLIRSTDIEPTNISSDAVRSENHHSLSIFGFISGFMLIGVAALIEIQLNLNVAKTNKDLQNVNIWIATSSRRKTTMMESIFLAELSILISNDTEIPEPSFLSGALAMNLSLSKIHIYDKLSNQIILGNDDVIPCVNVDPTIDMLTLQESCKPDPTSTDYHELYRCASAHQLGGYYKDLLYHIDLKRLSYGGDLAQNDPINLEHLGLTHMIPKFITIDARLVDMSVSILENYKNLEIVIFVCELVVLVLYYSAAHNLFNRLGYAFEMLLMLTRRISPIDIISNKELMRYLMNKNDSSSTSNITAVSILQRSADCILFVSLSGVIEVINPAFTNLLGFTPEQVIGQTFISVVEEKDRSKIISQMELIRRNEAPVIFEDHITCISDNEMPNPCALTILGMTSGNNDVSSFVIILRDEQTLIQRQMEAETAKKKSENLLYQILPRSIVIRLNQGEKDISFSVQSATIMFIDIVKFSEYSAQLTPQEMMINLSTLFGAFDDQLKKYPILYKIKLIGDVYMCAGGLFEAEDVPNAHAEAMVRYALDCINILEETNIKLNSLLNVRIGINTGGPVIAGVLGTDKPVFDIIGDPINVASRLQSTDFPGHVQISESTYQLISELNDLIIEPRGEIFLKGKGKQNAYLVKPTKNALFQLSSEIPI